MAEATFNRALASAASVAQLHQTSIRATLSRSHSMATSKLPLPDMEHLAREESERGTVLYLAYGSNLSNETFRGSRGIKPLSQVNVQVPSLRLTFDLPGIPYVEPCFANTARRDPEDDSQPPQDGDDEKSGLVQLHAPRDRYRKDRWHKGLIGVVYEVTPEDYAHIIQTEGGGSSYQDVLVDCHAFASRDPSDPVPQTPTLPAFKAHTLFAPALRPGDEPPKDGGRLQRPDTSYAQASARYLKLLTDGAAELGLPYEYQNYLLSLRPYTITTWKQRAGAAIFLAVWFPVVLAVFGLGKIFADDKGRLPAWLRQVTNVTFMTVWKSYDLAFIRTFGDGERTISDNGDAHHGSSRNHWQFECVRPASTKGKFDVEKSACSDI